MFGRKAIKKYQSRVCHRQRVQVNSTGALVKAGEGSNQRGEQGDLGKSRKAPRMRAQAAVALEEERKQLTGSKASSSKWDQGYAQVDKARV
jgi:hypothetical protein